MTQVLQLEKVDTQNAANSGTKDTWIFELPKDMCRREGYSEGTMVSLTVKNGGVTTSIIHPSSEIDKFVERVISEEADFFEEIERIGD